VTSYQPDSPAADRNGRVAAPNVDLVGEVINAKAALQAYQTSARLVRVTGQLDQALLDSTATGPRRSIRA
jgi:flagellar basal-body rod protein FlgC